MTDLPHGWAFATVGELADLTDGPFGSNLKTAHYTETGPRVIRLQNIGEGVFRDERAHIDQARYERLIKHAVRPGDIVAASLGESTPRACLVPGWLGPAIVKADCIRVRAHGGIDPGFLMWMLNSPQVRAQAALSIKGVGRPRLGLRGLRLLAVPVPPETEQRRILAAIEQLVSRMDAATQSVRRANVNCSSMRRVVLDLAAQGRLTTQDSAERSLAELVESLRATAETARRPPAKPRRRAFGDADHLPELPSGWIWHSARDVCSLITNGNTPAPHKMHPGGGDIPFVKVYNLTQDCKLDFRVRPTFIDRETHNGELARSRLRPGDVLLNIVGPPLGKVAVLPALYSEWNANQAIVAFRTHPEVLDPRLLAFWLQSTFVFGRLLQTAKATAGQFNLALSACRELPLPIPPREEQRRIIVELDRQLTLLSSISGTAESVLHRNAALRRSILVCAFVGTLVAQSSGKDSALSPSTASPRPRQAVT